MKKKLLCLLTIATLMATLAIPAFAETDWEFQSCKPVYLDNGKITLTSWIKYNSSWQKYARAGGSCYHIEKGSYIYDWRPNKGICYVRAVVKPVIGNPYDDSGRVYGYRDIYAETDDPNDGVAYTYCGVE